MQHKKHIKKLTIDLTTGEIPEKIKTVILEQTELIQRQQKELQALRKENEELKKNFN